MSKDGAPGRTADSLRDMVNAGFWPIGAGIALLAVGGVFVAKGSNVVGALLDAAGVIVIWAGFKTYRDG